MSDEGLENVDRLVKKFKNLYPKDNIIYWLVAERKNMDAIEFTNENWKYLAKVALGARYVDH